MVAVEGPMVDPHHHRTAPHRIAPHRTASRRQTANLVSPHQATSLCLFGRTFPCIGRSVDEQHGRHDANGYSTILDG